MVPNDTPWYLRVALDIYHMVSKDSTGYLSYDSLDTLWYPTVAKGTYGTLWYPMVPYDTR